MSYQDKMEKLKSYSIKNKLLSHTEEWKKVIIDEYNGIKDLDTTVISIIHSEINKMLSL